MKPPRVSETALRLLAWIASQSPRRWVNVDQAAARDRLRRPHGTVLGALVHAHLCELRFRQLFRVTAKRTARDERLVRLTHHGRLLAAATRGAGP